MEHIPESAVNVGQKAIARINYLLVGIETSLATLAEVPDFTGQLRTVRTHYRAESAELHPASGKEATYVTVPVRDAHQGIVQCGRNLFLQHVPSGGHVTTPGVAAVTLLSDKSGTGQDDNAFVFAQSLLMRGYSAVVHQ